MLFSCPPFRMGSEQAARNLTCLGLWSAGDLAVWLLWWQSLPVNKIKAPLPISDLHQPSPLTARLTEDVFLHQLTPINSLPV